MYDYLIVGAGFSGCVLAERLASAGKKVLLLDKRQHIGGNAYDYFNEHGILIHKYGPHIFHTNSKRVFEYLSKFTDWRSYEHKVLASIDGHLVPIPFNLNSIEMLFPIKYSEKLIASLINSYGYGSKVPILKLQEVNDEDLNFLSNYIYDNVFLNYTKKQWGVRPEELSSSVTSRVPILVSKDNRYFQDVYQVMPQNGYTYMFSKMLSSHNIHILLNVDYREVLALVKYKKLIYTGMIDEYFDHIHGYLPYRSLDFVHKYFEFINYQEVGTINYPNNNDYTRITESKHLTGQKVSGTIVTIEYPKDYNYQNSDIPYYPIPNAINEDIYKLYRNEAEKMSNVYFCGRLAEYRYYNMDQVVARALKMFETELNQ